MMKHLAGLTPEPVWNYFDQICRIPRPSGKEKKIINYLINFAYNNNLSYKTDNTGNLLISKKAVKGKENLPTIVFQSHVDMVCEKDIDSDFDFEKDAIIPVIEKGWVKAKKTTLGADNGIGIAYQLALLESKNLNHGPIECLFTVEEETGLTGAKQLEKDFFKGKIFINLDSEDEGITFIGCAGGLDTVAQLNFSTLEPHKDHIGIKIGITKLTGGHSGDDIHKGLGNSIHMLNRFIWENYINLNIEISNFHGGNLRNAIPREAEALITIPKDKHKEFELTFKNFKNTLKKEFELTEPKLKLYFKDVSLPEAIVDPKTKIQLINAIYACPNGVYTWSKVIPELVETSTNLASIVMENNEITITTSQRSSIESLKYDIASKVKSVFNLAGARTQHNSSYPGWNPDPNSKLLNYSSVIYEKLFKEKPEEKAIHAGLECGLFKEKFPDLDMISIGPTIKGAHSPNEKVNIESVKKYWKYILQLVENINKY